MVVDIFGGGGAASQRMSSIRGRPGKDALELSKYFPNGTASLMRKYDMSSSYVLDSKNDCELSTDDKTKKSYILAVKDKNADKPRLKVAQGSSPCELNEITDPKVSKNRGQYTMSFNGASVYQTSVDKNTATCGFFSNNKPGTGLISFVFKVQKDRPQTLLYCCTTTTDHRNHKDHRPLPNDYNDYWKL